MGEFFELFEAGILNSMGEYDPGNTEFYDGRKPHKGKYKPNPLFGIANWLVKRGEKQNAYEVMKEYVRHYNSKSQDKFPDDTIQSVMADFVSLHFSDFTNWYKQVYLKSKNKV